MARKNSGGKKFRRSKKFAGAFRERELPEKATGQKYGKLILALGNMQFQCLCDDGIIRRAHVPGSFYRRYYFRKDDHVLVSIRSFEQEKCDLLHKYHDDHVRQLASEGHLDFIDAYEKESLPMEMEINDFVQPEETEIEITSSTQDLLLEESDESDDEEMAFDGKSDYISKDTSSKGFYESEEFLNL